jgi:DNA-directed RNA polymerase subunit beta'
MPVLVEGSAIQIHPLVCTAFNADFDGDQMAVHVPLSRAAQDEAKRLMLSTANLLSPSDGSPLVAPTQDMVLGCYHLSVNERDPGAVGDAGNPPDWYFLDEDSAIRAFEYGSVHPDYRPIRGYVAQDGRMVPLPPLDHPPSLHDIVELTVRTWLGGPSNEAGEISRERVRTTIGRVIFNQVLPDRLRFRNDTMTRHALRELVSLCYRELGPDETAHVVDGIKSIGFEYATRGGMTIALGDIVVPEAKTELLSQADREVAEIEDEYQHGLITEDERYDKVVDVWQRTTQSVSNAMMDSLDDFGAVKMMSMSGARGNKGQISQLGGMRGLMADPSGRIIEVPVRSNFREGMTVLEYFISTHGARKGLADTALRTADSGYLTRRLVDVAQDVITRNDDCGTTEGTWITRAETKEIAGDEKDALKKRLVGRLAAAPVVDESGPEPVVLVDRDEEITEVIAEVIQDTRTIDGVLVRSPLTCLSRYGVCRACYGRNLAIGRLVAIGEAVGIIAAQSIGEPGTQLTMRTFHTGGVAGLDITAGLPRVEELFEARVPKGKAEISHIDGIVEVIAGENAARRVRVTNRDVYDTPLKLEPGQELLVADGDLVEASQPLARAEREGEAPSDLVSPAKGMVIHRDGTLAVRAEDVVEREYQIPHAAKLLVENGQEIRAGDPITDGPINPQEYLETRGREAVQRYLVKEVQKVYRSQGVTINDKHIEIIVRQMLRKVRIDQPGDSEQLPFELIDRFDFEELNNQVMAEGGEPSTAETVLLGVTKASLNTSSFLAAASFQETTRVLTEAAINGSKDRLLGLKENVIIGKLIPAGSGAPQNVAARREAERRAAAEALAGGELPEDFGKEEYNIFLDESLGRGEEAEGFNPLLAELSQLAGEPVVDEANPFLAPEEGEGTGDADAEPLAAGEAAKASSPE